MLGTETLRYLSRVSVLALKIFRYIVFITNRTFFTCMSCLKLEFSFIILLFSYGFFFHPIQLRGSLCVILCPLIPAVPLVGGPGVSLLYQTDKPKVNWNTNFWHEKLFFRLSILYYKLNQVGYLTNTFHFAVGLFSYRPQMSNCGKKKKVALKLQPSVSECFKTVTRNPIVLYYKEVKCCSWWCNLCLCPQIDWK